MKRISAKKLIAWCRKQHADDYATIRGKASDQYPVLRQYEEISDLCEIVGATGDYYISDGEADE